MKLTNKHLLGLLSVAAFIVAVIAPAGAMAAYAPGVPATLCSAAGPAAGQCDEIVGVAVDQSNGDIYVVDANLVALSGNHRISKFDASGNFVRSFGVGVATGAVAPETCTTTCLAGAATGAAGAVGTGARGIAVDPTTHIVYFVSGAAKVAYYDGTTGAFIGEFVAAGAPGAGQVVASPPAPAAFASLTGLAVDSSAVQHYLYVASGSGANSVIDKFNVPVAPATPPAYVCQITGKETAVATECHVTASKNGTQDGISLTGQRGGNLAVDGSGNIFVAEPSEINGIAGRNMVTMFDSGGGWVKSISTGTIPVAVATGSAGRILVAYGGTLTGGGEKIQEIKTSDGSVVTEITLAAPASLGIAVDTSGSSSKGSVYAGERASKQVRKFSLVPPAVTALSPAKGPIAGGNQATITGTELAEATKVEVGGTVVSAPFTENTSTTIKFTAPAHAAGVVDVIVTTVAGASANTAADNYTYVAPPVVTTGAATELTSSSAKIDGTVNANGDGTACKVEYGLTASYGSEKACSAAVGSGASPVPVSASLTGLTGNTTYHYRVVATNTGGTTNGADQSFKTKPNVFSLTVSKAGSGSGTVSCDGGVCAAGYEEGTKVTLTASAASDSDFAGWSGAGCSGTGSCVVTIGGNVTVTATFDKKPSPPPPPPESKCTVPKLAGKTLGQAKKALTAAHCTLGKVTKPKKKKGKLVVKSSKPGAGSVLAENSKVDLKLGPKPKKKKKK